ncbi:hypothetical protein AAA531_32415, partial [Pseudomonas aeruginosa]
RQKITGPPPRAVRECSDASTASMREQIGVIALEGQGCTIHARHSTRLCRAVKTGKRLDPNRSTSPQQKRSLGKFARQLSAQIYDAGFSTLKNNARPDMDFNNSTGRNLSARQLNFFRKQ